jgi:hypothetical protein
MRDPQRIANVFKMPYHSVKSVSSTSEPGTASAGSQPVCSEMASMCCSTLVTDREPEGALQQELELQGVQIIVAGGETE